MRPSVLTWTASSTNYLVTTQASTSGVALTLVDRVLNTNKYTGVNSYSVTLPAGNDRFVSITAVSGSSAAVGFVIVGQNSMGVALTETLTGPAAGTVYSVNAYHIITSITPNATSASTISVGIAGGNMAMYKTDIWNKNAKYTIAYSDVTGTVSLTPVYKVKSIETFVDGIQTINNDATDIYLVPIANTARVVVSPTSITTLPVSANCAISITDIPMSALFTQVANTTTGTFTQTIIQQGAAY